jgi:uncharacterized protein YjbI with pentapeptide repeats
MANPDHLAILNEGVEAWNTWRHETRYDPRDRYPDFVKPDLKGWDGSFLRVFSFDRWVYRAKPHPSEMREINQQLRDGLFTDEMLRDGWRTLNGADLWFTDLSDSDLRHVSLVGADLRRAKLVGANLQGAALYSARCEGADFTGANLLGAQLEAANLTGAVMCGVKAQNVNLQHAILVDTDLSDADVSGSRIYGVSAWNVSAPRANQSNLVLTKPDDSTITVDNLEVAQFIHLLLRNQTIRSVIDTITSKLVLVLGNFSAERKAVLVEIGAAFRRQNYLPVLFDFDAPTNRDLTETIVTLAHMARFVVADITGARSVAHELAHVIPVLPSVPIQPIVSTMDVEYAMFEHWRRFPWVLNTLIYTDAQELSAAIPSRIIASLEDKLREVKR